MSASFLPGRNCRPEPVWLCELSLHGAERYAVSFKEEKIIKDKNCLYFKLELVIRVTEKHI